MVELRPKELAFSFDHGIVTFKSPLETENEWHIDISHHEGAPERPRRVLPPTNEYSPTVPHAHKLYSSWIDDHPIPPVA